MKRAHEKHSYIRIVENCASQGTTRNPFNPDNINMMLKHLIEDFVSRLPEQEALIFCSLYNLRPPHKDHLPLAKARQVTGWRLRETIKRVEGRLLRELQHRGIIRYGREYSTEAIVLSYLNVERLEYMKEAEQQREKIRRDWDDQDRQCRGAILARSERRLLNQLDAVPNPIADHVVFASVLQTPIVALPFLERHKILLLGYNIVNLCQLVQMTREKLLPLLGFSKKICDELNNVLHTYGLHLGMEIPINVVRMIQNENVRNSEIDFLAQRFR